MGLILPERLALAVPVEGVQEVGQVAFREEWDSGTLAANDLLAACASDSEMRLIFKTCRLYLIASD